MLEYASMRFTLVCATPTTVPSTIVRPAIAERIGSHSSRNRSNDVEEHAGKRRKRRRLHAPWT